jgi:hypothetical protein
MLSNRNPECVYLLDEILTIPGAEELARYIEDFNFKMAISVLPKLASAASQSRA